MQNTYVNYDSLRKALKRNEIPHSGKVARLLLRTFVEANSDRFISADEVYELGLAVRRTPTNFSKWRLDLCNSGWLRYSISAENGRHRKTVYEPGVKLLKYVRDEKLILKEPATTEELKRLEIKFEKQLQDALGKIVQIIDPPDTASKREALARGDYDDTLKLLAELKRNNATNATDLDLIN